jgi:23S rRNA pseudouridine1911/1915/1917 synthase
MDYRKDVSSRSSPVFSARVEGLAVLADEDPLDGGAEPVQDEVRFGQVRLDQHGSRLDRALVDLAPEFSRSHLQTLIDAGLAAVDGRVVTSASARLKAGQALQVGLRPTAESLAFRPEPMPLAILHEDEHLIVVDKPAGLVVHPAAGNWSGTLLNGLLAHHAGAARLPRAGIVHRLDKDTSGLMVVGKTLPAVTALVRAIAARQVRRVYRAVVHGVSTESSFDIDAPIGRDPASRVRMAVTRDGREALTHVDVLASHLGCSAVQCRLHTGRTHQIRVHLASRGHPLVGDRLYAGSPALGMERQALHAVELALVHPMTEVWMHWRSEPPEDFRRAWCQVAADG